MGLFSQVDEYDRTRILDAAARARARGGRRRRRRAIGLYRRVLAVEPSNAELHLKLAPLMVEDGQRFDAWLHYRTAARAYIREDRVEKAAAIYREAGQRLAGNLDVWVELAEFERRRGSRDEALRVLLEARGQFRRRRERPQAIHLLRRARNLAPRRLGILLDLAALLAHSDQRAEALLLLERAEHGATGTALRKIRYARFRITQGVGDLWRVLRTPADETAGASRFRARGGVIAG